VAFHERVFETFVFLTDPKQPVPWHSDAWQKLMPALDPLVSGARGPAGVRSDQYDEHGKIVRLGRLGWNAKSHERWASGRPRFLHVEVWAPGWGACEREGLAPDVFFSITNEAMSQREGATLSFNAVVVLAATDEEGAHRAAQFLNRALQPLLAVHRRRPWGRSSGTGFTDAIQDLGITGVFKPGERHSKPVDPGLLAGDWSPLQ
jgi:hypothetical protein